jgi:hypothetical protein
MPLTPMEPDRFQKVCQALLVAEFPNVLCFPVGQADGGRDALRRDETTNEVVAFQVKTSRDPASVGNGADWLIQAIDEELPRVRRLIERGVTQYHLLTNVGGTGRLDRGSIDRVDAHLKSVVSIPSVCWWGDEIERRLEVHSHLRWQYPELLTGLDVMAELFRSDLTEHSRRRERGLKLFLEKQVQTDATLRFKQTDLHGALFGLFVDVEATFRLRPGRYLSTAQEQLLDRPDVAWPRWEPSRTVVMHRKGGREYVLPISDVGTADLLLHVLPSADFSIVLEGAPGQGKSTLGQYLCQVHRLRLLQRIDAISQLPRAHQAAPVRIPFRIDLRDLATWMQGEDPFSADGTGGVPGVRSAEAFLAALIAHTAGGVEFSVDDLHAVMDGKDVLLVLDGLDEVANIDARERVVDAVQDTIDRLTSTCRTLQTIVTSRPAAFANSPGFPEDRFVYLSLVALQRSLITQYADRWVIAKELDDRHAAEVTSTLHAKLTEPHIRDLARNPMQLAILLSLISTRGTSLPDKRTAIYDSYMDVFFSREAEKDETVRQNRELLIELHGYVAWHLHTSVERDTSRGNIAQQALIELLRRYLEHEGRDPRLAEDLFRGAVERVVALVSRVEGTYEFEVQPLREYFCARYLYTTAPLSRVGRPERGSKPDRFDAIARNPYWLNVTRFYAGCYSKGELGGLSDAVEVLWSDKDLSRTDHPRLLTILLLTDYVFAQSAPAVTRVMAALLRGLGTRHCVSSEEMRDATAALPEQSGRSEVRVASLGLLAEAKLGADRLARLHQVVDANGPVSVTASEWLRTAQLLEDDRLDYWFDVGARLSVFGEISEPDLAPLFSTADEQRIAALVGAGDNQHYQRVDELERVAERVALTLQTIRPDITRRSGRVETIVGLLSSLESACHNLPPSNFRRTGQWLSGFELGYASFEEPAWLTAQEVTPLSSLCRLLIDLLGEPADLWSGSLAPWETVIDRMEAIYGPTPASFAAALLGLRTVADLPDSADNASLAVGRNLLAHPTRGAVWREGLEGNRCLLTLAAYFSFAPPSVIVRFHELVELKLAELTSPERAALWPLMRRSMFSRNRWRPLPNTTVERLGACSAEYIAFLDIRLTEADVVRLTSAATSKERRSPRLKRLQIRARVGADLASLTSWSATLPVIRHAYAEQGDFGQHVLGSALTRNLTVEAATTVVASPSRYPLWLVERAEEEMRMRTAGASIPVGEVADREGWFRGGS